jgi:hypothetical protein
MGSPRVGSNPTVVVFCHCRFVCLQGLDVCPDPVAEYCLAVPGKIIALRPAACSWTSASHPQRHARDANGTWRSVQLRMDFHLGRLTVNV